MNGDDDDDNAETKFENINKLHSCSLAFVGQVVLIVV